MRLCELPSLVLRDEIETIPLLLAMICGSPGLLNGRIYANTHLVGRPGKKGNVGRKLPRLWNYEMQEKFENLGHRGLPPASA